MYPGIKKKHTSKTVATIKTKGNTKVKYLLLKDDVKHQKIVLKNKQVNRKFSCGLNHNIYIYIYIYTHTHTHTHTHIYIYTHTRTHTHTHTHTHIYIYIYIYIYICKGHSINTYNTFEKAKYIFAIVFTILCYECKLRVVLNLFEMVIIPILQKYMS